MLNLDIDVELFVCLIYFPVENDDAGGDLILYEYDKPDPKFYGQRFTNDVKPFATIPYERNTAVLFLNTEYSLHGVTVRKKTELPRRYVNIETEVKKRLFDVPGYGFTKKR